MITYIFERFPSGTQCGCWWIPPSIQEWTSWWWPTLPCWRSSTWWGKSCAPWARSPVTSDHLRGAGKYCIRISFNFYIFFINIGMKSMKHWRKYLKKLTKLKTSFTMIATIKQSLTQSLVLLRSLNSWILEFRNYLKMDIIVLKKWIL